MSRKVIAGVLGSLLLVALTSYVALSVDNGSVFPLLIVPVVYWAVLYGARGGLIGGVVASVYTILFVIFILDRPENLPYLGIAAFVLVGVGGLVGRLVYLRRRVALQERELQEAQGRLEEQLEAKRLLLVEVHHRIKNHMQSISGLLTMQAETMEDGSAAAALREAERRVQSM